MNNKTTNWINHILKELEALENNKGCEILNNCGTNCSKNSTLHQNAVQIRKQFPTANDDSIFQKFKDQYYNSELFTKNGNVITLIFEECTCSMVKEGVNNSFLCNCTVGYSKQIFETLFNKTVNVTLEKSILKGDSVCKQIILLEN